MELQPKIIFEDEYLVALDKPSGLVVNRSNTHSGLTLQDFVEEAIDIEDEGDDLDFSARSGILHRLDKDTSGVILMAKDTDTFANIQLQFKQRLVNKEYAAITVGKIEDLLLEIDAPIKRNPKMTFKYAIVPEGRNSLTVIEKIKDFTLNEKIYSSIIARPKTGRTHQIRVHCAVINHPIASDPIYCTSREYLESSLDFPRLMLHAQSIEIIHPKTGGKILLKSPLPPEFTPYFI